jgi:hypothetical protein
MLALLWPQSVRKGEQHPCAARENQQKQNNTKKGTNMILEWRKTTVLTPD